MRRPSRWLELLRLGRLEFAGLLFGVMLSGALSLCPGAVRAADVAVLLALAVFTSLWSFAHNDCCDAGLDRRSPALAGRPLVRGTVPAAAARWMIVGGIAANLAIVMRFPDGAGSAGVLLASMLFGWLYNRWSKKWPGSDVLFAASTALLCLLGALRVAGNPAPPAARWNMVWVVVAIQFVDHLLFNAGAGLKDVKNDRASSAVTTATALGVTVGERDALSVSGRFRGLIVLLRLASLSVLFASPLWTGIRFSALQIVLLAAAAAGSLVLTVQALRLGTFDRNEIGRRWVRQEAAGKLLVPLLLVQTAGWRWSLFLIAFPLAWYLVCNAALYRKGLSLQEGF